MVKRVKKSKDTLKQKQKQSIIVNINSSSRSSKRSRSRNISSSNKGSSQGFYQQIPPIIIQPAPTQYVNAPVSYPPLSNLPSGNENTIRTSLTKPSFTKQIHDAGIHSGFDLHNHKSNIYFNSHNAEPLKMPTASNHLGTASKEKTPINQKKKTRNVSLKNDATDINTNINAPVDINNISNNNNNDNINNSISNNYNNDNINNNISNAPSPIGEGISLHDLQQSTMSPLTQSMGNPLSMDDLRLSGHSTSSSTTQTTPKIRKVRSDKGKKRPNINNFPAVEAYPVRDDIAPRISRWAPISLIDHNNNNNNNDNVMPVLQQSNSPFIRSSNNYMADTVGMIEPDIMGHYSHNLNLMRDAIAKELLEESPAPRLQRQYPATTTLQMTPTRKIRIKK